jgi:hypothetical protein
MAGARSYTVLLDACVLYPAPLRDLLMRLAVDGLYHARWTYEIHDEWIRNLNKNRPDIGLGKLHATRDLMIDAVPDGIITNYEKIIDSMDLPDSNDRHVLAAGIVGHVDAIVTFNIRDFPEHSVKPYDIEIIHPDDFIVLQYGLDKLRVLATVKALRATLTRPPLSATDLLKIYETHGLPQTSQILTSAIDLI